MSSLAVRREAEPEAGSGEEPGGSAGDAFAALTAAARSITALAGAGAGSRRLIARALARLDRATRVAEELSEELAGREIRVRAIADAAVSSGAASRRLSVVAR
jgi:hypothetical protein